jgi:DNA-directed RNA polymerase subunit RPC12/RpoP
MVTIIIRCKDCGSNSKFVVRNNPAFLSFLCLDCGANIGIDVFPERLPTPAPAPVEPGPT